ncbi:MAG TPA: hypothetical protein VMT29_18755 [Steroidobacteraceae bacterium]|nr:hypothetical protein [Steroidobacteraceae bacterium]
MRKSGIVTLGLVGLAACAQVPTQPAPEERWAAYRAEVMAKQERGEVSAIDAQQMLRTQHRAIYGNDSRMDSYFAYKIRLLKAAEEGKLTTREAEAIAAAREAEIDAQMEAEAQSRASHNDIREPSD